jgi:hypothetical protein
MRSPSAPCLSALGWAGWDYFLRANSSLCQCTAGQVMPGSETRGGNEDATQVPRGQMTGSCRESECDGVCTGDLAGSGDLRGAVIYLACIGQTTAPSLPDHLFSLYSLAAPRVAGSVALHNGFRSVDRAHCSILRTRRDRFAHNQREGRASLHRPRIDLTCASPP